MLYYYEHPADSVAWWPLPVVGIDHCRSFVRLSMLQQPRVLVLNGACLDVVESQREWFAGSECRFIINPEVLPGHKPIADQT